MKTDSVNEKFQNKYLEMWIEDGIYYVKYLPGVIVDLKAAETILRDRLTFKNGKEYPSFADGRDVLYWTPEARAFQASEHNNVGMKAVALYVKSHVHKILIKFYLYFNKPTVPTACFTNKGKAVKWLEKYK